MHAELVVDSLDGPVLRTDDGRAVSPRTQQGTDALGAYERIGVSFAGEPSLEWLELLDRLGVDRRLRPADRRGARARGGAGRSGP